MALFFFHAPFAMTKPHAADRDPGRLSAALKLVLRRYMAQIRRRPAIAIPALLLPGVADALIFYAPPLVVARLLGAFARDERLSVDENPNVQAKLLEDFVLARH